MAALRRARRPAVAASSPPPRKPMALARRVSLFDRHVEVRLAPLAIDLLHGIASRMTEGEWAGSVYAGSTMLTIDLANTTDRVSDPPNATTAARVAALYTADDRARAHARRVGLSEAQRTAGCELTGQIDVESRARGSELHLSLNVEAQRRTP